MSATRVLFSALAVLFINELFVEASPYQLNDERELDPLFASKEDTIFQHRIVHRQAGNEAPKIPSEEKAEKGKALPVPLELEPDAESVTPNITEPKLPEVPPIPGFLPGPLSPPGLLPPSLYYPEVPGLFGQPPGLPPPLDFGPCDVPSEEPATPDDKTNKQEKMFNKMQCEFVAMQKKLAEFYKNIENELTELKKLNYNTVARLARLESILRTPPFGGPF